MRKSVLRKGVILVLTMCLVLGLSLTAFAATGSIALDKRYIHAGETVTITAKLDGTVENVGTLRYDLYFDSEKFELVSSEKGDSHTLWVLGSKVRTNKNGETYYPLSVLDATSTGLTINPGTIYTMTFKALETGDTADVAQCFDLRFTNAAHPDNTTFTEDDEDPVYLVVALPKSDDTTYTTDFPKLDSDNLTLHEIVLTTDAEIQSQSWDGDTLNVVLAEDTAEDAKVEAEFHVSMLKADGNKGDYVFNGSSSTLTADACNVHRTSGTLENGQLTLTGAFTLCNTCESEEDKAANDLVFTPKTYTLNFTVDGAEDPHTITIAETTNGKVTADKSTAAKGETVTLTVTPDDGYKLDTLTVKSGDTTITVTDNKFTMPDGDVTVTATFVAEEPETSILVKAEANVAGTVTIVEKGKAAFGGFSPVPYQIIRVPKGTTSVDVTFVAGTKLCDWGLGVTYCYKVDIETMTKSMDPNDYTYKTNSDGTVTVTVPIANFKYEDGNGIALEAEDCGPVNLMTFEEVESTEAPHTCVFDQKNTDSKFLKSAATCESPAVYYYSCTCKAVGTETFTSGEKADHSYENGTCTGCGQPDPSVSQYTVALGEDKAVSAGETVEIPVTLGHTNETVTTYNAFDLTFTYDPSVLKLDMDDVTGLTISDNNGTLRILRYGEDLTAGEVAFTLKFTALTAGDAKLTVTDALVGISQGAIEGDANKAGITNKETNVTVDGYTVNLPTDFTGETKVSSGESYTFTAKDTHYTYKVSATMGGEAVTVTDNGDGTFTIANVTGNLVITTDSKTGKIYNVTLVGEGHGPATAQYGEDYKAQLTKESGYTYQYAVTVNGESVSYITGEYGDITINGQYITGDVKIEVTKTAIAPSTYGVTFAGNAAGDATGAASATAKATYTFTVNKVEGATYTVTATMGGKEATVTEGENGSYSIANVTGALVITVNKQSDVTVEVSSYLELDGKTMFLVKANGTLAEGYAYAYDGTPMFKSNAYDGSWVYLVMVEEGTLTNDDAKAKITSAEASFTTLEQTYDVNETGKVDVNDAQLVYDLYNTKYQDFTKVSMQKFLKADTNADGKVDVADATAIVNEINTVR